MFQDSFRALGFFGSVHLQQVVRLLTELPGSELQPSTNTQ